jgi:hypothetical protein
VWSLDSVYGREPRRIAANIVKLSDLLRDVSR